MDETFNPKTENKEKLAKRVLVAEDTPLIRESLVEELNFRGCVVDAVENGQLLLDKLNEAKEQYDLIITDNNMNMPELQGTDVLKKIREDNHFKDLAVIVFSGDSWIKGEVEKLGGIYINKSDLNTLNDTLEKILGEPAK